MKKLIVLTALLVGGLMVQAQKPLDKNSSQYKAVEELFAAMDMAHNVDEGMNAMVDMQAKSNPMLESKKDALKKFMTKYMSWDAMRDDYLNLYGTEFTEAELKDMTAFYKTPTGKKLASKQTVLTSKATELSQAKMQAHMDELMQMMSSKAVDI